MTNAFYAWFFEGLGSLGGWFLFFLLAVLSVFAVVLDSLIRKPPALAAMLWRFGIMLAASLLLPVMIWRFSSESTQDTLASLQEVIFYLGMFGGMLPPSIAVSYFITYWVGAGKQTSVYPDSMRVPRPPRQAVPSPPPKPKTKPKPREAPQKEPDIIRPKPRKAPPGPPPPPLASAWLSQIGGEQLSFQLYEGVTTIGRSSKNLIALPDDTISGIHAQIRLAERGRFRLYDSGSLNGTYLNGQRINNGELLEPNDEIRFGDNMVFQFVSRTTM